MKKTQFRSFKQVRAKQAKHKTRRAHNLAEYRNGLNHYRADKSASMA
jgi:hypothetical protein